MSEGPWEKLSQVSVKGAQYDSRERQPHPKCLDGTRVVLLKHIYESLDNQGKDNQGKNQLIWLHGTAGVGKSAVAFTVAERMRGLKVTKASKEKRLAGTFFFSRKHTKRCTTGYFFSTLAYQLASNFPSIRSDVNKTILDNPALLDPDTSLRDQMEALFLQPLRWLQLRLRGCPPLAFVIDALDECTSKSLDEDASSSELADLISLLGEALSEPHLPVTHVLLTSRLEEHIRKAMHTEEMLPLLCEIPVKTSGVGVGVAATISLDGVDVDNDIYVFLRHSFKELGSRHPDFPQPSTDELARLASRAGRRFIVASTMMKFIDDRHKDPRDQLKLMLELTSELLPGTEAYKLYDRILSTCADPTLAYLHLSVVAALADPLPMAQISKLLGPGEGRDVESVLVQLRSVIDVPTDNNLPVNIYHSSIRDYASDPSNCSLPDVQSITSHSLLARSCLRLIVQDIPKSTTLLDALSELTKHSQTMKSQDPKNLKHALDFTVQPPESLQVLTTLLWLRGHRGPASQFWLKTWDGHAWLQTDGVRDWVQTQDGKDWLATDGGKDWFLTQRGKKWLQTQDGIDWMRTKGGQDWLRTGSGRGWLHTPGGRDWLKTLNGRGWLQNQGGRDWVNTKEGQDWLQTWDGIHWMGTKDGNDWLKIQGGRERLQTLGGREWLQTQGGRGLMRTEDGQDWLRTPDGREWLQTRDGRDWMRNKDGQDWLQTPGGRDWLQTSSGREWLPTQDGRDWMKTKEGQDWLQAPGGRDWLQTSSGREWLPTLGGRGWMRTKDGQDWLQTPDGKDWLQTPDGKGWLQTPDGKDWLQTPDGKDWLQTRSGGEWLQTRGERDRKRRLPPHHPFSPPSPQPSPLSPQLSSFPPQSSSLSPQPSSLTPQPSPSSHWPPLPSSHWPPLPSSQTPGARERPNTQAGRDKPWKRGGQEWPSRLDWLNTPDGRNWLQTSSGRNWLKIQGGKDWLQTQSMQEWLKTKGGKDWLQTQGGKDWLQTKGGKNWLQTQEANYWLRTLDAREWLKTQGGKDWLQTQGGNDWLKTEGGNDWLQTQGGKDWLKTEGGKDWLQTQGGNDWLRTLDILEWLKTQGGKDWLTTQGGKDWLQTPTGRDWLQTSTGRDWLQTSEGQTWRLTTLWVTMEEFSSTLEVTREFIVPESALQPALQAIQKFKSLPDFLIFPTFLALRHQDNSTSALQQGHLQPSEDIIHAMRAFSSFAYEAREQSQSTPEALSYACQHWVIHLSRAPNPWDGELVHIFNYFWTHNLLSWLERQWCLKDLRSCLTILSEGEKLAQEHLQAPR